MSSMISWRCIGMTVSLESAFGPEAFERLRALFQNIFHKWGIHINAVATFSKDLKSSRRESRHSSWGNQCLPLDEQAVLCFPSRNISITAFVWILPTFTMCRADGVSTEPTCDGVANVLCDGPKDVLRQFYPISMLLLGKPPSSTYRELLSARVTSPPL